MPSINGELRALEAEVLYTPLAMRQGHLARLEQLIPELATDSLYTYETIFHRVTQFSPDADGEKLLPGRMLQQELGRILLRASAAAPLEATEDSLPLQEAARRCRVTLNTVRRWAMQGLPLAVRAGAAGRIGVSVREGVLRAFLERRKSQRVQPGRRLSSEELEAIASRAKVLTAGSLSFGPMLRRLAAETGYSVSTIRRIVAKDRQRTAPARRRAGLSPDKCRDLVDLYRSGAPVEDIANRLGRSSATVYRLLNAALTEKVISARIHCIPNPAFTKPDAERAILKDEGLFTPFPEATPDMPKPPPGLPPYLAELYCTPLLPREREKELFLKYNYIKHRALQIQERVRRAGYRPGTFEEFQALLDAAEQVKRILIRCNLRLVVSIARRHTGPLANLFDLVSEGNLCLMRAVECYNCAREARFATYASWAIAKHFARVVPEENYRLAAFVTGQSEMIERRGDERAAAHERSEFIEHIRALIARAAEQLTPREREVITAHYGTDGGPARTLEEIGNLFGLTRERIRQIEARALGKLRLLIPREAAGLA